MRNTFVLFASLLAALSAPAAFAATTTVACQVVEGKYGNSTYTPREISLEFSGYDQNPICIQKLNFNATGVRHVFQSRGFACKGGGKKWGIFDTSGSTHISFTHPDNESANAMLLIDRSPGAAVRKGSFDALLTVVNIAGGNFAYSITCKLSGDELGSE